MQNIEQNAWYEGIYVPTKTLKINVIKKYSISVNEKMQKEMKRHQVPMK